MWLQGFKLVLKSKCRQFWWWLWTLVSDIEGCKNSFQLQHTFGRFEVFAAVLEKICVFTDVTLYYWVCSSWRFERRWWCYDSSESQEPVTQWHNVTSLKRWTLRCTCSWILTHANPDITKYTAVSMNFRPCMGTTCHWVYTEPSLAWEVWQHCTLVGWHPTHLNVSIRDKETMWQVYRLGRVWKC
jgi:hypothetical protein